MTHNTNRLAIEPGMFDAADALTLEAAMQEKSKVEQTLILGAPKLLDILGVGSFSLPIPGTDPVRYVAAGTLAEIERATRQQDTLQQIADFGQEQNAAPAAQPAPVAAGVESLKQYFVEFRGQPPQAAFLVADVERLLASLAPVAAEPVRQVPMSQRESFEHWFSDEGKWSWAIERSGEGYKLAQAQSAWQAWKACYAALDITGRPSGAPVRDVPQVPTAAEAPSQWISVEDRLPDDGELVQIFGARRDHGHYQAVGKHVGGEFFENIDDEQGTYINITHWMPLPAAPSVEVKGEQGEMGGDHA